jgi:hypothetical protein
MQTISAVTKGFVMDLKFERDERESDICAYWLKQSKGGRRRKRRRSEHYGNNDFNP